VGSSRFRQILLPGVITSLYAHPYIFPTLKHSGYGGVYGLTVGVIFAAEILLLGIVVSSATKPIYYLFEGFRFPWITAFVGGHNRRKVDKYRKELAGLYSGGLTDDEQDRARRLISYLSDFPNLRPDGRRGYFAERPTRLGNIIASYELYPKSRYGIDGVFFWFHILYKAPDSARQRYEDSMAFAESLVLASAAGILVFIFSSLSLVGRFIGEQFPGIAVIGVSPPSTLDWIALIAGIFVGIIFYALALSAHREVRDIFWALTDLAMGDLLKWIDKVNLPVSEHQKTQARALRDFLSFLTPFN
jgi:hypothetical protein